MKIRVPGTTSNLAVGFDCIGAALSLFNEFEFQQNEKYELYGFDIEEEKNLVLIAYKKYFKNYGLTEVPVIIKQTLNEVPQSRGLGSSATCIIAGVLAANELSQKLPLEDCIELMVEMEGHPDNIYPAVYGGMVSVFKDDVTYAKQFEVHPDFHFYVNIPDHITSTKELREALNQVIPLQDAVYNISRALHLDYAISIGELEYLKAVLKDKLHQDIRASFIPGFNEVQQKVVEEGDILLVSGSGSTLLIISKAIKDYTFEGFITKEVSITRGVEICE